MGTREEEVTQRVPQLVVTGPGILKTSESALLALGHSRTNDEHAKTRGDSSNWNQSNQGRAQPSDSDRNVVPEPQTTDMKDQTGYSRDAKAMATAFEPLD